MKPTPSTHTVTTTSQNKKLDKIMKINSHQVNFPPIKNPKDKKKKKNLHSEFKQSLKHNSSNHSITGKKIIPGVKRVVNEHKKFYSPYSQRPAPK